MLEFEQNTGGSLIKEVSEATFMQDIVEASKTKPVIVDFWAPWCGPCKTLGPQLEEAVKASNGAVTMAKVNVDEMDFKVLYRPRKSKPLLNVLWPQMVVKQKMVWIVQFNQPNKCWRRVILRLL